MVTAGAFPNRETQTSLSAGVETIRGENASNIESKDAG